MESIYLAIASYRDPLLQSTIDDAFSKAARPEVLSVGCFIQVLDTDPALHKHLITNDYGGRVKYKVAPAGKIFSVTKCRNVSMKWLAPEHNYVLQIDAHTRFEKDWDVTLLKQFSELSDNKAILSCYPHEWIRENGWDVYLNWSYTHIALCSYNTKEAKQSFMDTYDLVPTLLDMPRENPLPAKNWYISGAFIFAPADFFRAVRQPDWIAFWGEELFYSLLAFTNGWTVYAPCNRPIYSLYAKPAAKETHSAHKIWEDFPLEWHAAHKAGAKKLVASIINKTTGEGYLGTERPIEELYEFLGYNLSELLQEWSDEYETLH